MELDPLYADVVIDRWQRFTGKRAVLERTGTSPIPMKPREEDAMIGHTSQSNANRQRSIHRHGHNPKRAIRHFVVAKIGKAHACRFEPIAIRLRYNHRLATEPDRLAEAAGVGLLDRVDIRFAFDGSEVQQEFGFCHLAGSHGLAGVFFNDHIEPWVVRNIKRGVPKQEDYFASAKGDHRTSHSGTTLRRERGRHPHHFAHVVGVATGGRHWPRSRPTRNGPAWGPCGEIALVLSDYNSPM